MTKMYCDICGKEIEPKVDLTHLKLWKSNLSGKLKKDYLIFDLCLACSNKLYTILTSKKVKI